MKAFAWHPELLRNHLPCFQELVYRLRNRQRGKSRHEPKLKRAVSPWRKADAGEVEVLQEVFYKTCQSEMGLSRKTWAAYQAPFADLDRLTSTENHFERAHDMKRVLVVGKTKNEGFVEQGALTTLLFSLLMALTMVFPNLVPAQQPNEKPFPLDPGTLLLLQPQADGLKDKKGAFEVSVKGARVVPDERFGHALEFGDAAGNGISVIKSGSLDFSRGLTLEMWLQLQQTDDKTPNPGGNPFTKMGSFYTTISKGRLNVDWMVFPTAPIFTTTDRQYDTYPVSRTGFPGYIDLPVNRWVHLALTYDPVLKVARTWVDGRLDWTEYYSPEEAMPLQSDPRHDLNFARGMKNVRVGEIRVSHVSRAIDRLTPFETYVHALPYRKKSAVILDHIEPTALPLEVVFQSGGKQLHHFTLTNAATRTVFFDPPVSEGQYPLTIQATSNGKELYSREVDLYAGDDTTQAVKIDDQNRFVINGKPIFPLMVYHTFLVDIPVLAKIGFTMFSARYPDNEGFSLPSRDEKTIALTRQFLDAAKENGIFMVVNDGIYAGGGTTTQLNRQGIETLTDDPALAIWYGADEPGRTRIEQLQPGYTAAKQLGKRPILSITNRNDHLQRLGETVDILGPDPYPIPNVSLRDVADTTKYSVNAVAGLKPVWTVLPQYQYYENDNKRPSEEELRCMSYLAIASGAQGLGIYAWDDRNAITKEGWYTKDHPEDLKILETVIGELKAMQDVITIPNSSRVLTFAPTNPALHAALKEDGDGNYLMIVNDSRKAEEATLSLDGLESADGVEFHDASIKLTIREGKVAVQLPPLGTRLYRLVNGKKD